VDVVQQGNSLYLTGDTADDWVAVCDEGGQVVEVQTVSGTGMFRGIKRVIANLGDGGDTFEFHQAETGPNGNLKIAVDLGAGDDQFLYRTPPSDSPRPDPDQPAKYSLGVRGGVGNDVMAVGPEYVPGLDLDLQFDLGAGNDRFDASYKRDPATAAGICPCISLDVEAEDGDDHVNVAIGTPDTVDPMCMDDVTLSIGAGAGSDNAVIAIVNVAVDGSLKQMVEAGGGDNSVVTTLSNVTVGGLLKQLVNGGGNHDEVEIVVVDGRIGAVSQKVNVGDGDDIVSLSWKKCEILGPAVTRVALAEDHDVADITFSENKYFAAVTTSVDAGGGDDIVAVMQSNPNEFLGPVKLRLALGDGDDEASFFCDGDTSVAGSMALIMNTGSGDDRAEVLFTNPSNDKKFGLLGLRVNAGIGDDHVNVVIRDANAVAGPLTVAVDGGAGDDGIVADVDFTPRTRTRQLDPGNAPVAALINLRGGTGTDTIDGYTEGTWSGVARFILRGDDGDDAVGFHWGVGEGSMGTLAVDIGGGAGDDVLTADTLIPVEQVTPIYMRILGGVGDDVLSLNLLGGPDTTPEPHLYLLDGGLGFDLAHAPAGAVVRNCESRI
jgi:hypothetical protein